jgi:hypothetical protein
MQRTWKRTGLRVFVTAAVLLVLLRACFHFWQKAMRGDVILTQTSVTFALKMPRYDRLDGTTTNEVQRYEDWEHNGTYTLIADPSALPTPTIGDYRPSSC